MSDRFTRLFELSEGLYSAGSPVIVEAGVLLKDNQTGKIISQLKFRNVSTLTIKALMVGLSAYDISGKEIAGVDEYQYLDMNVEKGQVFGSDKAIVMPSNITRSVAIKSLSVIDINGNVHTVKTPMNALPGSTSLNTFLDNSGNLIEQYKLDVNEEAVYKPQKWEDMWQCSCGRWNKEPDCYVCRAKMNIVFSSCDIAGLTMRADERLELLRLKEEERLRLEEIKRAEKEAREREELEERDLTAIIKKYRTKRILALVGTILFAVISIFILVNITTAKIIPNSKYDSGINRMNSGDYESAVKAFTELDGYKNSKTLLSVCNAKIQEAEHAIKYADAMALMEAGKYEEAKQAFQNIGSYANATEMIAECQNILAEIELDRLYANAVALIDAKKYIEAKKAFENLDGFRDSKERIEYCIAAANEAADAAGPLYAILAKDSQEAIEQYLDIFNQNNMQNEATFQESNGWIYGQSWDDSGNSQFIKVRTNGDDYTVLNSGFAHHIYVADNYVYYMLTAADNSGIYKTHISNGSSQKLSDSNGAMQIVGNHIYYADYNYENEIDEDGNIIKVKPEYCHLYRCDLDGSNITKIIAKPTFHFYVFEDGIMYQDDNDNSSLHTCRLDGTGDIKLNDVYSYWPLYDGEYIFYVGEDTIDGASKRAIWKIKPDGSDNQLVANYNVSMGMVMTRDKIFFINGDDYDSLYRINKDGSDLRQISKDTVVSYPQLIGNYIKYTKYIKYKDDNYYIEANYFCKFDGTDKHDFLDILS